MTINSRVGSSDKDFSFGGIFIKFKIRILLGTNNFFGSTSTVKSNSYSSYRVSALHMFVRSVMNAEDGLGLPLCPTGISIRNNLAVYEIILP
jgi:hypothetical protein